MLLPPGARANLAGLGDQLVGALVQKAHELDLGDRAQPVSAMPNAVPTIADSASGVSNTRCVAESGLQAVGRAKDAAELADVLAHDDHALVGSRAPAPARD